MAEEQPEQPNKKTNTKGLWWKIPLALMGLWLALSFWTSGISTIREANEPMGLPMCDSSSAKDAVSGVFANWPDATVNLTLLDLRDQVEVSFDETAGERVCEGNATLNTGDQKIRYRLFKQDRDFFVEVELL